MTHALHEPHEEHQEHRDIKDAKDRRNMTSTLAIALRCSVTSSWVPRSAHASGGATYRIRVSLMEQRRAQPLELTR